YENKTSFPNYVGHGKKINWEKPGFAVEFLKIVEKKLGLKIKFVRLPWKRCLATMQKNEVDGVFNASYKKERLKFGRYPTTSDGKVDTERRITEMAYVFFKLRHSDIHWDGKKFTNLNGNIGTILGYSIGDILKKEGFSVDDGASSPQSLLDKLIFERFSVMAASDNQIQELISKSPDRYKDVVKLEIPYQVKPYYVMLSHNFVTQHPDMAEKIWDTIGKFRESQEVEKIRLKYFNN
ncbi:transporter substrate-binding domain-containing protein, partial [Desulfobacterales bacterium HSG16]|nr:transporter substrate-binding domain-containing protein [Desulfobacterales bacterium HSG16]